ncbi:GL11497 [Drosophila persimilis]|uniref:GL11497 n=1 Tax=Drosophila persimilis TaxID=7234 RepID=B4GB68_DROPE|nr:GL11497 [Drosophila persimilis]
MQYLSYALQTSTRLLTNQNHHNQNQYQPHPAGAPAATSTPTDEDIAHACCSRGAQLLRQRQQELAKRRALEDQINANELELELEAEEEDESKASGSGNGSETEEGAVGGEQLRQPVQ